MRRSKVRGSLLLALLFMACTSTAQIQLQGTSLAPAAEGVVRTTTGPNRNTQLEISVQHLAPPGMVVSGATTYVVWVRSVEPGAMPQNVGALRVDRNLEGTLKTLSPLRYFDLSITAEPGPAVARPSGAAILSTQIRRS